VRIRIHPGGFFLFLRGQSHFQLLTGFQKQFGYSRRCERVSDTRVSTSGFFFSWIRDNY